MLNDGRRIIYHTQGGTYTTLLMHSLVIVSSTRDASSHSILMSVAELLLEEKLFNTW